MREFAGQAFLAVWYAHLDVEDAIARFQSQMETKRLKATEKMLAKAHTRDSMQALRKLTTQVDGQRRIISDPPMIEPVEEVFTGEQASAIYKLIRGVLGKYRRTLQSDRGTCSSSSRWSRWPARWSGWAASAPAAGSC